MEAEVVGVFGRIVFDRQGLVQVGYNGDGLSALLTRKFELLSKIAFETDGESEEAFNRLVSLSEATAEGVGNLYNFRLAKRNPIDSDN